MLTLPDVIIPLLQPFKVMFQARTWSKAQVLLIGAILATRKRTVTSALRVMGLSDDTSFARYHHVLNRAGWSPLRMAHCLLLLLIQHLDHCDGPLVFGIDETLERRRRRRIKAKGIYRDGVRSSASHFVKASGLRWVSLMWLAPIPWAHRTWALPVLTALAPSERYYQEMGRTHKKLTDWARQMIAQLRRWLPHRTLKQSVSLVIQQPVPHGPDHDLLLRAKTQLGLDAVEAVPDGHRLDSPGLRNRGV